MEAQKQDIRALSKQELRDFFTAAGDRAFRGDQVYQWLWQKGVHNFEGMSNLSKHTRALLEEKFCINHIAIDQQQRSTDGTIKNAIRLHDSKIVESVLIPTKTRTTACVSSQVGCSLDCTFCATARLKRMRNLNPDEIFDQVYTIDQQSRLYYQRPLSNIVFMGMGEPLMNYSNVLAAVDKITHKEGLGMSPKRITLSTSGIPKMIKKLAADEVKFNLALSLHTARQEVREQIMPFAKSFPLQDIQEALQHWYDYTRSRVTLEYIVWKNINDQQEDINALIDFAQTVPTKVNLIQYNAIDDDRFEQADKSVIKAYTSQLEAAHITVTVRQSRGQDIDAACGQLANKNTAKIED